MKNFILIVILLILGVGSSQAQFRSRTQSSAATEATLNYASPQEYTIAGIAFYRSNISNVISLRTSITAGKIGASDADYPIDAFATKRGASFNLFLFEAAGTFEYHFLDWRDSKRRLRFTPYLFAGAALFGISGVQNKKAEYSNIQMAIPFGGGMKYVLNPKYYIAFEIGIRKTFFDYLDNISDGNPAIKNYQYGNVFDNDNYFFTGITLTYTFYDIPCPGSPYR